MRLLVTLILFAINCQSPSNHSLVDEFVHGEVNSRKRAIEKAFALWHIRGQVDVVEKINKDEHSILFTDTCQEEIPSVYKLACVRLISQPYALAGCSFLLKKSITFVKRTPYQSFDEKNKIALLTHEIGHCIGLSHSNDPNDIMNQYFDLAPKEPSESEIAKVKTLWPEGQLFKFSLSGGY